MLALAASNVWLIRTLHEETLRRVGECVGSGEYGGQAALSKVDRAIRVWPRETYLSRETLLKACTT